VLHIIADLRADLELFSGQTEGGASGGLQALVMGVDLLDLAPIPGLRAAALTLLDVWDALQNVGVRIFLFFFSISFLSFFLKMRVYLVWLTMCDYR
jgi:hypothetical protein